MEAKQSRKVKLTSRAIDALPAGERGGTLWTDAELPGFALIVYPTGAKVFCVRYRDRGGRLLKLKVGRYGKLTPKGAREEAKKLLGAVELGQDPSAEKKAAKAVPTFKKYASDWLSSQVGRRKRMADVRRYVRVSVDAWGKKPVDEISRTDAEALYKKIFENGAPKQGEPPRGQKPYAASANRWVQTLRPFFADAIREGFAKVNPIAGLKRYVEAPPRDRVLSDPEEQRLLSALAEEDDPAVRIAFVLLLETGCRLSEALNARWEDLDLDDRSWRVPAPKSGRPQTIPLSTPTVEALKKTPHVSLFVVAGNDKKRRRADLKKPWDRLRKRADLPDDVHIHDLRRSYGKAVADAAGLRVAQRLLRHSDVRTTASIYAQVDARELRAAVEAQVLPFKRASA